MSANIEFSCTGCVFAEHTNGRQNGCRLGRLEKLCPEDILAEGLESDSEEDFSLHLIDSVIPLDQKSGSILSREMMLIALWKK